jgi:hypothetical protein
VAAVAEVKEEEAEAMGDVITVKVEEKDNNHRQIIYNPID